MFFPHPVRALPMPLAHHSPLCDAPTMLQVRQSHYSPPGTIIAAMSPRHFALGRRRLDDDGWGNQRNEVRTEYLLRLSS